MKIKVINELDKKRVASIDSLKSIEENLGDEAKQLLLTAASEERTVLKNAGLDTNIAEIETERGINLERENFENAFGEKVFTKDELKDICYKYHLKLLHSQHYKGGIDPVLGAKIVAFFKKAKMDATNYEASNNLFIMAPPAAFNLPSKKDPFKIVSKDPVLFYRVTRRDHESMYIPIHQWGNDFTIFRRMVGAVKYNFWSNALYGTVLKAVIIMSIFALIGWNPFSPTAIITAGVLGFCIHMLQYLIGYAGTNGGFDAAIWKSRHLFSKEGWQEAFN